MKALAAFAGLLLFVAILWDGFETIILPRRVTRRFRLVRLFYRLTWRPWSAVARKMDPSRRREAFLSVYGPLSLLVLFGVWAVGLLFSFALLHWAAGSAIHVPRESPGFWTDLYLSGTTFFTLGLGDVTPQSSFARGITIVEAGIGFGFLAVVIAYLPVLYGAFSRREVNISLLDARAGSPPTAAELLRRHAQRKDAEGLRQYLRDWELWSAELMESHLSYPVLCYFRSQHDNQSWLAALAAILDACALLIAFAEGALRWQAQLTFAISRHAVVDLTQVMKIPPSSPDADRLPVADLEKLQAVLAASGVTACSPAVGCQNLDHLRQMYEPYIYALSERLLMSLPPWTPAEKHVDNWRTSAWARSSSEVVSSPLSETTEEEHF